jgi:hypothetical protein
MPGMKQLSHGVLLKLKGGAESDETHAFRPAANLPFLPLSNQLPAC